MAETGIVVIGASAGGIQALRTLVSGLPADFPAPICVVLHTSADSPGMLPEILGRAGPLPASSPRDGDALEAGHIYVAPPDHHLVVERGRARVTRGPRENRFRPAVDPLFRSAAQVYGPAATGVILTGSLDDGTAGLWAIKQRGGTTIVQDPADAAFPSMPRSALAHVEVDRCLPIGDIAPLLTALAGNAQVERKDAPVADGHAADHLGIEVSIAKERRPHDAGLSKIAQPSRYACPECHGVLLEVEDEGPAHLRCHTGHAYTQQALLAHLSDGIEEALWNAIRTLEEGSLLMRQMADGLQGEKDASDHLRESADEARRRSEAIRQLLTNRLPLGDPKP